MEALELSERTVPGKGGKAGPQGKMHKPYEVIRKVGGRTFFNGTV